MDPLASVASTAVTAFLVTYLILPRVIRVFGEKSILSPDVHKPGSPRIPCLGGLAVLGGLMAGFLVGALALGIDEFMISMFMLTTLLLSVIGMIDYLVDFRQRTKLLLCLFAGVPLAVTFRGETLIDTPFGNLELGLWYLLAIPLVVAASANLTNMLAGFNGLEAGLGCMTASTMLISALIMRQGDTALMMAALLGALLAFLRFNWHPARIFLSDVGTLSIGAVMAVAAITGRIKLPFLMVMAPHVIDFFMKASTSFRGRSVYGDTEINADGGLDPPPYPSLPHVFMRRTRLNEPRLVRRLLLFESLFCAITLLYVVARAMDFGLL